MGMSTTTPVIIVQEPALDKGLKEMAIKAVG